VASSFARRAGRAGRPGPGVSPDSVVRPTGVATLLHLRPGRADPSGGEVTAAAVDAAEAAAEAAAEVFQPSEHVMRCIELSLRCKIINYEVNDAEYNI